MFEISTSNSQFYYDLFYFLAIIFAGIAFIAHGKRKHYPLTEWTLIYASAIIFLIVGTKLLTYSWMDWKQVFTTGIFPYTESKTILGGIIGGVIGVWIVTKVLRFRFPVLDAFAISFPLAMGIQRIGCFMAGCCYGRTTELPWSVSYASQSWPHYFHLERGFIDQSAGLSAGIHPNQLYQTLLCFAIAFVIWKIKDRIKRPGNLFFISITLYFVVRIIVEFTRDDTTQGLAENLWMGMNRVQWILTAVLPFIASFIFIREKKYKHQEQLIPHRNLSLGYFVFLCFFMLLAASWFTQVEGFYIAVILIPTTLLCLQQLAGQGSKRYKLKLVSMYAVLFAFLGIGIVNAQKTYKELTSSSNSHNKFQEWSLGYGHLQYNHYHAPPLVTTVTTQGCYGPITTTTIEPVGPRFNHNSNAIGLGFSHMETFGKYQRLIAGGTFSSNWNKKENNEINPEPWTFDFSPTFYYNTRWLGMGGGFHVGSSFSEKESHGITYTQKHDLSTALGFNGRFILGPYDIFYLGVSLNEYFPYQISHRADRTTSLVVGSGLGMKNGSGFEVGTDGIALNLFVQNRYGIRAKYLRSDGYLDRMWQVALTHRFHKTTSKIEVEHLAE